MGLGPVAIIDTSRDFQTLLKSILEEEGVDVCAMAEVWQFRDAGVDFGEFVRNFSPKAVVLDIAVPYDVNWRFFERIRALSACSALTFVLTTTNERALRQMVGETDAIEIVGKPADLNAFVDAVRRACGG